MELDHSLATQEVVGRADWEAKEGVADVISILLDMLQGLPDR